MNTNFTLSPQQQSVLDWSNNPFGGSLNLVARAGCGKSSTLLALVKHLVARTPRVSIFIGAYNRPIADEFIAKLKKDGIDWKNALCNTIHGAGKSAWCKVTGWKQEDFDKHLDDKKLEKILDRFCTEEAAKTRLEPYITFILRLTSLAKQRAFGVLCQIDDKGKWYDIIDHYGLDEDLPEESDLEYAVKCAIWLYRQSLKDCTETIDYDDMILAPLYFKARFWKYDWVMIDEAQDTNPARSRSPFSSRVDGW